ncbi:hypothetical protein EJ08DRAFT_660156 [Tothia fuscella]|uniref:Uncharacterized protein n=1 Tax=Tothia fuscella TaxID=1048955 RepID=A0A9P4NTD8_9PEZI|nr:hypothetical protein EJ08DRAFT_660156 [Tothia fuscella]
MSAGVSPQGVVPETPQLGPSPVPRAADSAIPTASLTLSQSQPNSKFVSPSPAPTSAITPPPSSQIPSQRQVLRTPSPVLSQLTSPPPTNRSVNFHHSSQHVVLSDLPTTDQVNTASMEQLRGMVESLSLAVRDARTTAAHFKLQHNMLILDSQKAVERMNVELEMTQREVEVLQEADERRRMELHGSVQMNANAALISDLNRHYQLLQGENEEFRAVLGRATMDLEDKDGQILTLKEENQRLRHRIRQNREHMNGLLDSVSDGSPRSIMGTPHRTPHHNTTTPRHLPRAQLMPSSQGRQSGAFDALLLADQVLNSQGTATAPSTPKTSPLRHRMGHTRNTHSLSSLPTTPSRRPFNPSALRTPPHLTAIQEPPSVGQTGPPIFTLGGATRRRASSDSTITASSVDENEQRDNLSGDENDDAIPESQASQVATSMLRSTPSSSQQKQASKLTQSRITGKVTKASAGLGRVTEHEKRRLTSYGNGGVGMGVQGSPSKRSRHEGVGLGIGLPGRGE